MAYTKGPAVEGPDFDRMAIDREMLREMRQDRDVAKALAEHLRVVTRQLEAITRVYVSDSVCREHTATVIEEARAALKAAGVED